MFLCDMRSLMRSRTRLLFFAYFLLPVATAAVGDNPDYSGSYTLTGGNRRFEARKAAVVTLTVVQTLTEVEFTIVKDGQRTVNKVGLDGKEAVYNSLRGPIGKCKARIKRKTLTLDILWTGTTHIPGQPDIPSSFRSREVWELSADLKKLTIRGEDETLAPFMNRAPSWTEIYTRN
jgi:hypothetical protein